MRNPACCAMKGEDKGDTRKTNRKEDIVVLWKKGKNRKGI